MSGDTYDYLFKLLLVGDSAVGKTSLLLRFTQGEFKDSVRNTVGVDLKVKMVNYRDRKLKLTIWDTAGQERFRTLTSAYYRGAHGIILVYSITDRESFVNLSHWLKEVDIYSTNDAAIKLLIGNKSDCSDSERAVSKDEGRAFAKERGMLFIEASAKTQEGVAQAFDELIQKILDVPALLEGEDQKGGAKAGGAVKVDKIDDDDDRGPAQPAGCC